jgi:hypothetical protein
MKMFEACEYGAGGDVQFGAVVEKKCEGDFRARLKAPQERAYQREMAGTMFLSFTAFCRAQVARRYSHQARKNSGSSRQA